MGKKRAPQKGKTVTKPQEIIVDESKLNWKPVDIPDTLDDFGGFYGLEEIDGVDVKVVDGKVTFVTKKDSKVLKDSNKEKVGDDRNLWKMNQGQIRSPSSLNSRTWTILKKES